MQETAIMCSSVGTVSNSFVNSSSFEQKPIHLYLWSINAIPFSSSCSQQPPPVCVPQVHFRDFFFFKMLPDWLWKKKNLGHKTHFSFFPSKFGKIFLVYNHKFLISNIEMPQTSSLGPEYLPVVAV